MPDFNFTDFYKNLAVRAADALSAAAAEYAEDPTGTNAARLRMAVENWVRTEAVASAMECHKL